MKQITQRVLGNEGIESLGRAGSGEKVVVTFDGHPVTILGPIESRQWVGAQEVRRILSTPTDPAWEKEHRRRPGNPPVNPADLEDIRPS